MPDFSFLSSVTPSSLGSFCHEVAVVDDAHARAMTLEMAPAHGQHRCGAEIADEAIIVDVHLEAEADQARGHGVEDGAHADRGRTGHRDGGGREVRGPVPGQRLAAPMIGVLAA